MSEWQPIETAPSGRAILIYRPVPRRCELVQADDNDFTWTKFVRDGLDRPSHWMPVPKPPSGRRSVVRDAQP